MILSRDEIKELNGTGSLEVVLAKLPAEESQSVQPGVGRSAVCVVAVIDSWPHRSGGYVVVIEFVRRIKPGPQRVRKQREEVRLMKPGHGETKDPRQAMRDKTLPVDEANEDLGPPPEPEMVDKATEARFAKQAEDRGKVLRGARNAEEQARSQARRLRQVQLTAARKGRSDVLGHFDAIEDQLRQAERKLDEAA